MRYPLYLHLKNSILFFLFAILSCTLAQAQNPTLDDLPSYVDEFSGNMSFDIPLLMLEGHHGESFPVSLDYYNGGIGVDQTASWAGLGWNLNVGEISRSVNGVPDDFDNIQRKEKQSDEAFKTSYYTGPIHFNRFHESPPAPFTDRRMDIMVSGRNSDGAIFEAPNYDNYSINAPGFQGAMELEFFEYANINSHVRSGWTNSTPNSSVVHNKAFTQRPTFRYSGDYFESIYAPQYNRLLDWPEYDENHCEVASYASSLNYHNGNSQVHLASPQDLDGCKHYGGVSDEGVPLTTTRVVYFTNQEIHDHYFGSIPITNFIDCSEINPSDRNINTVCDPEGIGAFQVYADGGLIYHFSLPVYVKDMVSYSIKSDDLYNMPVVQLDPVPVLDNYQMDHYLEQQQMYASSWKLTAITGQNYSDSNGNNLIDTSDKGYSIGFRYDKLTSDFQQRFPYYGHSQSEGFNKIKGHLLPHWLGGDKVKHLNSAMYSTAEAYYIRSIATSKETLYFIKDLRLDNRSRIDGTTYTPSLKIDKILKVSNAYTESELFPNQNVGFDVSDFPSGTVDTSINSSSILHTGAYNDNLDFIQGVTKTEIALVHDYSLSKKNYSNFNSAYTITNEDFEPIGSFELDNIEKLIGYSPSSSTDYNNSGKLTLKEIKVIGRNNSAIHPSFLFDYYDEIAGDPLDFDHQKKDMFGLYKSDFNSTSKGNFPTSNSAEKVHAWSLKKVTYPLGSEVDFVYESDQYSKNATDPEAAYPDDGLQRVYRIKSVDDWRDIELYDPDALLHFQEDDLIRADWKYTVECDFDSSVPVWIQKKLDGDFNFTESINTSSHNVGLSFLNTSVDLPSGPDRVFCDPYSTTVNATDNLYGYFRVFLKKAYGGGIRTKEIQLADGETGENHEAIFTYTDGIVASEPQRYAITNTYIKAYEDLRDSQALPSSVGYSKTEVSLVGDAGNEKVQLEFNFHNHTDIQFINSFVNTSNTGGSTPDRTSYSYCINQKLFGFSGLPINHIVKSSSGSLLSKKTFEYEEPSGLHNSTRSVNEIFYKNVSRSIAEGGTHYERTAYHNKKRYPKLLKTSSWNYGRENVEVDIHSHNNINGQAEVSKFEFSLGDNFNTKIEYAFEENPDLGPKSLDMDNKNMTHLTSKKIKYLPHGELVSGSTTSWDDSNLVLNYSDSGAECALATVEYHAKTGELLYDGTVTDHNSMTSHHITLLDEQGKVLEQTDVDGYYSSSKLNGAETTPLASASNANYFEFTHCGFEAINSRSQGTSNPLFEGDVKGVAYQVHNLDQETDQTGTVISAHTGKSFAKVTTSSGLEINGPSFYMSSFISNNGNIDVAHGVVPGKTYRASVWVNKNAQLVSLKAMLSGSESVTVSKDILDDSNITCGNWTKIELLIEIPEGYQKLASEDGLVVYCENTAQTPAYIDDLRVQPLLSTVQAVLYDLNGNVEYQLGNDNMFTKFYYDDTFLNYRTAVETPYGLRKIKDVEVGYKRNLEE